MEPKSRSSRYLSIFFGLTLGSVLVILPGLFYLDRLKGAALERVEKAINKAVTFDHIGICFDEGLGFRIRGLSVQDRETGQKILDAEHLFVGIRGRDVLKRKVTINVLYLYRPRLFLSRDASGTFNIADLFSSSYLKETYGSQYTEDPAAGSFSLLLWKDRFVISEGEIVVRDVLPAEGGSLLYVRGLEVKMHRPLFGSSLQVNGACDIAKDDKHPFHMVFKGVLRGLAKARSLSEIDAEMSVEANNVYLEEIVPFFVPDAFRELLHGRASVSAAFKGHYPFPFAFQGTALVNALTVTCPSLYTSPLFVRHGVIDLQGGVSKEGVNVARADLKLDEVRIQGTAELAGIFEGRSHIKAHLRTDALPLPGAWRFLPTGLLNDEVWDFLSAMTKGGHAWLDAELDGDAKEFAHLDVAGGQKVLRLHIRCKDVTVVLPVKEPYRPFRHVGGTIDLRDGHLYFSEFSASYGGLRIPQIEGWIEHIHRPRSVLDVNASVDLAFPEALEELDHGIIPEDVRNIARSLADGAGQGQLALQIRYEYGQGKENLSVMGEAQLHDVSVRHASVPGSLDHIGGKILFSDGSVTLQGLHGVWGEAEVTLEGEVQFGGQHGTVGALRFAASHLPLENALELIDPRAGEDVDGAMSLAGTLQFSGDKGVVWRTNVTAPRLLISLSRKALPVSLDRLVLEKNELGRIAISELSGKLKENMISGAGYVEQAGVTRLYLELWSPMLDWNHLWDDAHRRPAGIKKILPSKLLSERDSPSGRMERVELLLHLKADTASIGRTMVRSLSVKARHEEGTFHISDLQAVLDGGRLSATSTLWPKQGSYPFQMSATLDGIDIDAVLGALVPSQTQTEVEGTMFLSSEIRGRWDGTSGWEKDIQGDMYVDSREGVIRRYELISKFLTLINVTQWSSVRLSDFKARGMPYQRIAGHLHIDDGRISTEDLVIAASFASMAVVGSYDFIHDDLDVQVAIHPLDQLDAAIDHVPFLGKMLKGQDGTTAIVHYRLSGPLKRPRTAVIPFKGTNDRLRTILKKVWGDTAFQGLQNGQ